MNAVDLASLLCSRLCHDLMSPGRRAQQRHRAARRRARPRHAREMPRAARRQRPRLGQQAQILPPRLRRRRAASGKKSTRTRRRRRWRACSGAERRIELGWVVSDEQVAQGRGQAAAQPRFARRRRAGSRRPARRRCREQRRIDRAGDPRRRPANPARPGASRDARQRRRRVASSSRARRGPGWPTALPPRPADRSSFRDPSAETLLIGAVLPRRGITG